MPELLTPAFPCSSFAFPNIPLKFSPHSPVQKTVIGKPIQGILLFRRKQVIDLLPRLAGTDGLYDFSYLHVGVCPVGGNGVKNPYVPVVFRYVEILNNHVL